MAYNESLANRIREHVADLSSLEEKQMMGGLVFMYNDKMLVGILKDELLCRVDHEIFEELLERRGCRPLDFTSRRSKGWVLVEPDAIKTKKELDYWIGLALDFNKKAKSSKKKKK